MAQTGAAAVHVGTHGRFRFPLLVLAATLCIAAAPMDALRDPAQEAHAHVLFRQVRCLVCQNESIDDSEAPLAADLRGLIRQQVAAGRPDAAIRAYLVKRYGEFVLLKPAFSLANALLWLTPFVILAGGLLAIGLGRRRLGLGASEAPLNPIEEAELARLMPEAAKPG